MCTLPQWHVFGENRRYDGSDLQPVRPWMSCLFARFHALCALPSRYSRATCWYARLPEMLGGGFPVCQRWQHLSGLSSRDILACAGGVRVHSLPCWNSPAIAWRLGMHSLQCVFAV